MFLICQSVFLCILMLTTCATEFLLMYVCQANKTRCTLLVFEAPRWPDNSVSCASDTTFSRNTLGTISCILLTSHFSYFLYNIPLFVIDYELHITLHKKMS